MHTCLILLYYLLSVNSYEELRKTPTLKKIGKERQSLAGPDKRKGRSSAFLEDEEKPVVQGEVNKKRGTLGSCTCKSGCKNKRCSCKKDGPFCSALHKCVPSKCANRETPGADLSDTSVMSTTDLENSEHTDTDEKSGDTTVKLLDSTFKVPELKFTTPARSPLKQVNRNSADIFAQSDSDIEATPTN